MEEEPNNFHEMHYFKCFFFFKNLKTKRTDRLFFSEIDIFLVIGIEVSISTLFSEIVQSNNKNSKHKKLQKS